MVGLWHLNNINWLRELPAASADLLRTAATLLTVQAGETVFEPEREPQFVFILETGLVRMYRICERGEQVTFGFIRAGEVFGELAAFSDKPRESYAAAITDSTIIKMPKEVFSEVIQSRSSIVFSVAAQIEDRFKQIESRVEDLVFRSARSRLARIILQLAQDFGQPRDGQLLIGIRLTHAELATLAGTSRPTVSIALGELEDEGLIVRRKGRIALVSEPLLQQEAEITGW